MTAKPLTIGSRRVGEGEPCLVIAEAGSNHNGRLDTARQLIDVAAEAGADAVKFQIFRARKLYPETAGATAYLGMDKSIFDIIAEMEMPYEWLPVLAEHSRARGVMFMASVFDEESTDRLDAFVDVFKVASYEMTHTPLLRYVAGRGKPVLMSTGTASLDEVAESVDAFRDAGGAALGLFQCTAAYPAPLDSLNLRAMQTMAERFGVPVGLSDHSRDPLIAPIAAVALGASFIEKHFTLGNDLPGPDHRYAIEPGELRAMVGAIRQTEAALGSGRKDVQPVEEELRAFARRSIFTLRDIAAGEIFTADNIAVLRCGQNAAGLPPREFDSVIGKKAARAIASGRAINAADCV